MAPPTLISATNELESLLRDNSDPKLTLRQLSRTGCSRELDPGSGFGQLNCTALAFLLKIDETVGDPVFNTIILVYVRVHYKQK